MRSRRRPRPSTRCSRIGCGGCTRVVTSTFGTCTTPGCSCWSERTRAGRSGTAGYRKRRPSWCGPGSRRRRCSRWRAGGPGPISECRGWSRGRARTWWFTRAIRARTSGCSPPHRLWCCGEGSSLGRADSAARPGGRLASPPSRLAHASLPQATVHLRHLAAPPSRMVRWVVTDHAEGRTEEGIVLTIPGHRVIVFLQENKTTDFYFASMAAWGALVKHNGPLLAAPPNFDQPHDRSSWVHFAMGDYPALDVQIDTDAVIPFYAYLAKEFVFCDHHFAFGSNSTSGHLLAIGGQSPTLKNPPFVGPHPVWDLPSIFTVAEEAGVSWAAFPDGTGYPTKFYRSLNDAAGVANVHY